MSKEDSYGFAPLLIAAQQGQTAVTADLLLTVPLALAWRGHRIQRWAATPVCRRPARPYLGHWREQRRQRCVDVNGAK